MALQRPRPLPDGAEDRGDWREGRRRGGRLGPSKPARESGHRARDAASRALYPRCNGPGRSGPDIGFGEAEGMAGAERSGLDGMVERIHGIAVDGLSHPDAGSLLHAYIACLASRPGPLPNDRRDSRSSPETSPGTVAAVRAPAARRRPYAARPRARPRPGRAKPHDRPEESLRAALRRGIPLGGLRISPAIPTAIHHRDLDRSRNARSCRTLAEGHYASAGAVRRDGTRSALRRGSHSICYAIQSATARMCRALAASTPATAESAFAKPTTFRCIRRSPRASRRRRSAPT
jgi:hypothetical protein